MRVPPAPLYNAATDGYDRCMAVHEHVHDLVATLRPVVLGVTDGALDGPTPCSGWTVRDLTNHLLGTTEAMRRVGAKGKLTVRGMFDLEPATFRIAQKPQSEA